MIKNEIKNDDEMMIQKYMNEALKEAEISLNNGETPVGCVFVYSGKDDDNNINNNNHHNSLTTTTLVSSKIIARASNKTNITRNGTRHAEMVAIDDIILNQKLPVTIFRQTDLYVTCEPCIMCAAALSKLGIRKVYFGCHNDRFGGNGSVISVHQCGNDNNNDNNNNNSEDNDVFAGLFKIYYNYQVRSGVMETEAINLFQRFYEQLNPLAPPEKQSKKKLRRK